jgi:hypothetical protein
MRKGIKDLLVFTAFAVSIPLIILLLIQFTPHPPVSEMNYAREALSKAWSSQADTYSKKYYNQARIYYDSAMVNWHNENKKFIYSRNYKKVLHFAQLSAKKANLSADNSLTSSSGFKVKLKQKIDSLKDLITEINKLFTTYPLSVEIRDRISKGKMLLEEAEVENSKGQYLQANRKITDSEYLLTASYDNATSNLKNYFKSYSVWKHWVDLTMNDSKKNRDYSIIIDKFSRKCFIYQNGSKKYEFDTELGKNWVGDKREKGDNATPEGMYRITKKIDCGRTKYYKALLLDYPNDEDRARFDSDIARGLLPPNAKIGGLIEIHGNGGKGVDWTEGCIALTDSDMDIVFKIAKGGTPVTIVGSTVDLQYVMNR